MQKVLVTGGNIGNHVAEMLACQGTPVRVLVRSVTPDRRWDDLGIEQVAADAGDPASLAPAFNGVEGFFSVSPLVENLVQLGTNTIEAAKNAGVRYIVRSSAMGAAEKVITMGRLHREVEKAVEAIWHPLHHSSAQYAELHDERGKRSGKIASSVCRWAMAKSA